MSTLRLTTISNQSGSASVPSDTVINGSAKAWVNFNGTGAVAIRAAFNVSSITDNGTGDYTINFSTALVDANYAFSVGFDNFNNAYPRVAALYGETPTASALRLKQSYTSTFGSVQTFEDTPRFTVAVFR